MVYLAKGSFWLSMINVVMIVNGLLIAIAFANLLPQEIYGEYKYVLSIFAILKIFSLPGMHTAVNRAVSLGYEGTVIKGLKAQISWGLVGSLISAGIAIYYYIQGNEQLAISLLLIALFIPLFDPPRIFRAYLNGKKYFKESAKCAIPIEIITTITLITALFLTDQLFIILIAYFAPYFILRTAYLIYTKHKYKFNDQIDNESISLGKHLTLISSLSQIANQIDKIILWHFLGAIALAIYSFAIALPDQIKVGIKQIRILALPKFSSQDTEATKRTLPPKILKAMIILIPIIIIYIIAAPWIFNTFFPQYSESIFYSQIYAISIVLVPQSIFTTYLQSKAKKKQLYTLNIIRPIIKIALLIILIPLFGIIGAILSIIITRTINLAGLYYLFKKS